MTPGCRASILESGGLFSTMFANTITSKSCVESGGLFSTMFADTITSKSCDSLMILSSSNWIYIRYGSADLELVIRFALVPVDFQYRNIIASGFRPVEEGKGYVCRVSLLS
ncbi:hypothetical protein F2Q69_00003626 [Brassica cretica]|uniref:Uncharacterized protein n=1 Tax=Brassica cretica TaxID=69181 RepID=A0A8S9NVR5_BRACR|nr:hypothetical protein F2Q69_00003626 [Brassica cretica]